MVKTTIHPVPFSNFWTVETPTARIGHIVWHDDYHPYWSGWYHLADVDVKVAESSQLHVVQAAIVGAHIAVKASGS